MSSNRLSSDSVIFKIVMTIRKALDSIIAVILSGNKYNCPFCGKSFSKLLAYGLDFPVIEKYSVIGAGRRTNCRCPNCSSIERTRLVYLYLKKKTNIFTDKVRILHFAPEAQMTKKLINAENIDFVVADLDPDHVKRYNDVMTVERIDVTDILYGEGEFDMVICNHVIDVIPDDLKAMREIFRVLKPGGQAIVQEPVTNLLDETMEGQEFLGLSEKEREQRLGNSTWIRLYSKVDYMRRLRKAGFEVELFNFRDEPGYGDEFVRKYALNVNEDIFVALKPEKS